MAAWCPMTTPFTLELCNMHQIQTHQHPATPPHPVANLKDLAKSVPLIANKIKIALVSLTCESPKKSPPTWTECMTCAGGFRFALAHQKVYQISHWFEPHRRRHVCSWQHAFLITHVTHTHIIYSYIYIYVLYIYIYVLGKTCKKNHWNGNVFENPIFCPLQDDASYSTMCIYTYTI